jgi:hypothetical protein
VITLVIQSHGWCSSPCNSIGICNQMSEKHKPTSPIAL